MIFEIIDQADGQTIGVVKASNLDRAEQEADCYVAESGIDRECDYVGYDLVPLNI